MSINKEEYERLKKIDTTAVYEGLKAILDNKCRISVPLAIPLAAYALYVIQKNPDKDYSNIEVFQNDELNDIYCEDCAEEISVYYTSHHMIEYGFYSDDDGPWEDLLKQKGKYSFDELIACVLFGEKTSALNDIPFNLEVLINYLLGISTNDNVINFFPGAGSYFINNFMHGIDEQYYSTFSVDDYAVITHIRLKIIGKEIFHWNQSEHGKRKIKKAFCQLLMDNATAYSHIEWYLRNISFSNHVDECSLEWKVAEYIIEDSLTSKGKLVMVFRKNSISNRRDRNVRRFFLQQGYVEHVICLPDKLYSDKGKTVIVLFSYNNHEITFSDLSAEHDVGRIKGKSIDVLSDENVCEMVEKLKHGEHSVIVPVNDINKDTISLDPQQYLVKSIDNGGEKTESLSSLGLTVKRAAQLVEADIVTDEDTSVKCLAPKNIKDGVVVKPFKYVKKEYKDQLLKFKLENGDILITKNGNPFKVAVFENDEPETVVANGNLYIIKNHNLKVDPYYIKAFFESERGIAQLNAYSQGNTPLITIIDLKEIRFPFYCEEERQRISVKCESITREIMEMHKSINQNLMEMNQIF